MKSRLFSLPPNVSPSRPSSRALTKQSELEVLSDQNGSVAFGWAAPAVLYTRFQGGLSAETGQAHALRLGTLVAQSQTICFFCDESELKYQDLLARSAFARVILSNRRRFASLVILTWAEGVSPATHGLAASLGEQLEVLMHVKTFEARLLHKAPQAKRILDPKLWKTTTQSRTVKR